jgi:outer membrane protein assembly factor BamB
MLSRSAAFRSPRFACVAGVLLAAGAIAPGCSSPSPFSPGKDQTANERLKASAINQPDFTRLGYHLDWTGFPVVTGSLPVQFFKAYPDMAVALEQGSTVTILETNTGARRCADQLANPLTKFVGIARSGNRLFCASEAEIFTLDAATCNMVGRVRTARNVDTEPVLFGNLLIFGSTAGELFAHLAGGGVSGVKAWGFLTPGGPFDRKPALIGGAVGAVSQAGQVVFLDAGSGTLLGQTRIYAGAAVDPVADDNLMYVASLDQSIYAFAPQGAALIWRYRTAYPLRVQPTVHGDRLYCAVPGQGLVAFDAPTGKVLWTTKDFLGSVVATNHKRLVAWDGKDLALIDPERGDLLDHAAVPNAAIVTPDKFDDGNLYVVSKAGVVSKFLPR